MDSDDLVAGSSATFQDPLEDLLLRLEGSIETRARVQPHLTDITRFGKVALPDRELCSTVGDELRMQAQGRAHMTRPLRQFQVPRPRPRRRRHREGEDLCFLALAHRRSQIGIQIQMAMQVDEPLGVSHQCPKIIPALFRPLR